MTRKEMVHSLPSVKLVLGNGFDLHCGLRSSFQHYYVFSKDRIEYISKWYESFKKHYEDKHLVVPEDSRDVKRFKTISIWDFFFTILCISKRNKDYKNYLWFEVENDIKNSLLDVKHAKTQDELIESISTQLSNPINWDLVYDELTARNHIDFVEIKAIAHIIDVKTDRSIFDKTDFFNYLLNELKQFEKEFAIFLNQQLVKTTYANFGIITYNEVFISKAIDTINEICGFENLVSIESFNYTSINHSKVIPLFSNINGNLKNPIFGVDTVFPPSSPKFVFTKTSRRMENDAFSKESNKKEKFKNLIIYGHSLNEADYSYFFPIFDQLGLMDNNSDSKIIVSYSVFNEENRSQQLKKIRNDLLKMFEQYAKENKYKLANRFLDSLTTRGRVILYEIPLLNDNNYGNSFFDEEWERIEKL